MSARKPVTIRGVEYPSIAAAGQALGVAANTISGAAARGVLDNVGTANRPVEIEGRVFRTATIAAYELGVSVEHVYHYRRVAQAARALA